MIYAPSALILAVAALGGASAAPGPELHVVSIRIGVTAGSGSQNTVVPVGTMSATHSRVSPLQPLGLPAPAPSASSMATRKHCNGSNRHHHDSQCGTSNGHRHGGGSHRTRISSAATSEPTGNGDPSSGENDPSSGDDNPSTGDGEGGTDGEGDDNGDGEPEDSTSGVFDGEQTTVRSATTLGSTPTSSHVPIHRPLGPGPAEPPVNRRSRLSSRVEYDLE
ncbi:hypothetical protein B0H16DRAFT_128123 [Mycena metata]|uniref:Uncharacterized protein n=1 Tax=Mycena metata TaxID=1033252 RepID=A0AAD7I7R2_9AGAR|nr:hypothetical protein B0H16DRAFT_128123 [Mycena metata]